jgi:hypothetical protein
MGTLDKELTEAIQEFFPWLTCIWNCWMPVNFYARRDFDGIHNGFPGPPAIYIELGPTLHILGRHGMVEFFQTGNNEALIQPALEDIELALSMPAIGPSNAVGRLMVSLTDLGRNAVQEKLAEFSVAFDRNLGRWVKNEFIPQVLTK